MNATDERIRTEQLFHDEQAAERSASFRVGRADLRFADEAYLDHETWIRPAFAKLGELKGKRVLDYGCGHGMASVVMARAGANVDAFDLSPGYVCEARERAGANGVTMTVRVANGEELPYPDASFDAVWGCAILHHLDLAKAASELSRVLKPGGIAVFCEPWGGNPLLAFARRWLPYPGKHRTPDERPLVAADLPPLRAVFPHLTVDGFQLFGMVRRVLPATRIVKALDRLDVAMFRAVPRLKKWARYVVLTLPND
jgi:SAM-dependent methyltransferase